MKQSQIDDLFANGKRIHLKNITVVYSKSNESELIISAPIKIFPRANKRNRVKRLIREAVRLENFQYNGYIVFLIYKNKTIVELKNIREDISKILIK